VKAQERLTHWHLLALVFFSATTVLLIPLKLLIPGGLVWLLTVISLVKSGDPVLRRNMGVLLATIIVLALSPINTELSTSHFIALGLPFLIVIVGPYWYMKWKAPGTVVWRFWPRQWSWRDVIYVLISIPLSWLIIRVYFFYLNPDLATNWPLPVHHDEDAVQQLVIGINGVGIWDELFFINTVYVLLRGIYPARLANLGQAVVYTSVLYTMAFTGAGPVIVYLFALTQGVMYEKSGVLLYVLLVHLIVDVFLVLAILQYHYPGLSPGIF
jgi:hypothetical protein